MALLMLNKFEQNALSVLSTILDHEIDTSARNHNTEFENNDAASSSCLPNYHIIKRVDSRDENTFYLLAIPEVNRDARCVLVTSTGRALVTKERRQNWDTPSIDDLVVKGVCGANPLYRSTELCVVGTVMLPTLYGADAWILIQNEAINAFPNLTILIGGCHLGIVIIGFLLSTSSYIAGIAITSIYLAIVGSILSIGWLSRQCKGVTRARRNYISICGSIIISIVSIVYIFTTQINTENSVFGVRPLILHYSMWFLLSIACVLLLTQVWIWPLSRVGYERIC